MGSFKIIRRPNNQMIRHMLAKCQKTKKDFSIRLECDNDKWYMVYATKIDISRSDLSLNLDEELQLDKGLYVGKEYSCPYCGRNSIVRCGECGRITCNNSKYFQCAYCGNSGEVNGTITSVRIENSPGSLKKKK